MMRVKFGNRAFAVAGTEAWNSLPVDIRSSDTVTAFKNSLKTYLFKLHHVVTILTLIGALVVTHAMLRCLTSWRCIIIIIIKHVTGSTRHRRGVVNNAMDTANTAPSA